MMRVSSEIRKVWALTASFSVDTFKQVSSEIGKVWALTKRDMYHWTSYKSQMTTTILSAIVGIASWGFIATFRNVPIPQYNTDYVSFLLVGILISSGIFPLHQGLERRLSPWTLETVLMTGVRPTTFVLGTVAWTYFLSVLMMLPQLVLGIIVFGAKLNVNPVSLILALVISSTIVFSLAMISSGVRVVTKVSDPVTFALTVGGSLFAGMAFPIEHLEEFIPGLSNLSWILPHTWIYHIVRLSALSGGSLLEANVASSFLISAIIALAMLPLGIYTFGRGLRRAKRDGTLGWF